MNQAQVVTMYSGCMSHVGLFIVILSELSSPVPCNLGPVLCSPYLITVSSSGSLFWHGVVIFTKMGGGTAVMWERIWCLSSKGHWYDINSCIRCLGVRDKDHCQAAKNMYGV